MFEGQPKGLYALALANTGERFGYYTMLAVFALFLRANYGLSASTAGIIYSSFLMLVYFFPLFGGMLADKFGFGKMVTSGIVIMFLGYLLLAVPLGGGTVALVVMLAALLLIGFGTGLFKGNLQVMVGNLYDDPQYADRRDSGFSIFYMAINIGALFAPTAAVKIKEYAELELGYSSNDAYHFSFAVACVSLIISMAIYYAFRAWFKHTEGNKKASNGNNNTVATDDLSPAETKQRITALCLVFAVVIFFWMAFHQNGLSLTYFADEFTARTSTGIESMAFDVWNLVAIIILVYACFAIFQSKILQIQKFIILGCMITAGILVYLYPTISDNLMFIMVIVGTFFAVYISNTPREKITISAIALLSVAILAYKSMHLPSSIAIDAPIFQQFNPFYVVALTPVSMAIFGVLARKGKEPSAPRKIAYGMVIAAVAFAVLVCFSIGLPLPQTEPGPDGNPIAVHVADVTPNLLIGVYLILTFGELLLSPMGISFVSKVAPPKYKGMMMGGWFVATALGNQLVLFGGVLWGAIPLWACWAVFMAVCLIAAVFMFAMMKRLEKVC